MDFSNKKSISVPDTDLIFDSDFHPDKDGLLAVGTLEGDVHVLRTDTNEDPVLISLSRHHKGNSIRRVRFGGGNLLFSASKTVKLYDLDAGKCIRTIKNCEQSTRIYSMAIVDNHLLCTGDDEGSFRLWDYRANRAAAMEMKECNDFISDLDVDSAHKIVLATSGEGTLTAFNVRAKKLETQSGPFDNGLSCVRFKDDKERVFVGGEDGYINTFFINEYDKIIDRTNTHSVSVEAMEILGPDNHQPLMIAVGGSDGQTRIMTIFLKRQLTVLFRHDCPVESISIQKSTGKIASIGSNVVKVANFQEVESSSDSSDDEKEVKKKESNEDTDRVTIGKKGLSGNKPRNSFFNDL